MKTYTDEALQRTVLEHQTYSYPGIEQRPGDDLIYYRVPDSDDEKDDDVNNAPRCLSPQSERSPGIHPNSDSDHDEDESVLRVG